jgi:hypothetical protein
MRRGVLDERLVLFRCELRQFLHEGHDIPQELVTVGNPPSGHASHLDPVLHDPEFFCGREVCLAPKVRCSGIKTAADFSPLHPGSEMAGAAHVGILPGA